MRSHPDVSQLVEAAAVALLCGWDPLTYARAAGDERLFADAVLERAAKLRAEELDAVVRGVGAHVGNRVGEVIAKVFSR